MFLENFYKKQKLKLIFILFLVNLTAYEAKGITASGTIPVAGKTAAVSRDLKHLFGKRIQIEGHGIVRIDDLTHKRIRNTVDIAAENFEEARNFGKRKGRITVLD